jgi:thiol-disulfide isomerase/thioredoxin
MWLEPLLWIVFASTLYLTGYHTEVIGGAQRLLLMSGIMKPDLEQAETKADLDFDLIDRQGRRISLSDYRGKVIFINVWATWCPPCIAEMPGIADLYRDSPSDEVVFMLISSDEDREKLQAFIKRKEYEDLPIFQVPSQAARLPAMYRTGSIPSTFVIDKKGNLRMKREGMADFDNETFRQFLTRLANEASS